MADRTSRFIVRLIDGVSGPAAKAGAALGKLTKMGGMTGLGGGLAAMQANIAAATERNNRAIANLQGRIVAATAGVIALRGAFNSVVGPAVSFEAAMADIAKVSNFDDAGLDAFGKTLRRIATSEVPLAVDQLAALAAAAAQAGVSETDLEDFVRLTAKAAVAWGVTGEAAGESLAKLRTALNLTNAEIAAFADAINHVSDSTAASAPDLLDFSQRVAAQGEFFAFAKEETLAFGAAMIAAGAPAEVAATSFRNMGRALTKGASAPKRMALAFRTLGLDAKKVAKAMQDDAVGTTLDVIDRLNELPEHMRASVLSDLFGDEARALAPLIGQADKLSETLGLVAKEQNYLNSVGKEFERRARTTEYAMQRFRSQLNDVALALGGALLPALRNVMSVIGPVALSFARIAEANPVVTAGLVGVTAGLMAMRIGMLAVGIAGRFAYGGLLSVATGSIALLRMLRAVAVVPIAAALGAARTALVGFAGAAAVAGKGGALKIVAGSMVGLLNPVNLLRGAFVALRAAMLLSGVGAVVAAIAAAGTFIYNNWQGIKELFAGIAEGFRNGLGPAAQSFAPVVAFAERLFNAVSGLLGPLDASNAQWRSWGETIGGAVATGVNAVASALSTIVGLFSAAYDKAVAFGGAIKRAFSWGGDAAPSGGANMPGRARGGPVTRGRSYIVGEKRPEIFTPGASGYITPRVQETGNGTLPAVNVTNHLTINGATDVEAVTAKVKRAISEGVREAMRAAQGDLAGAY